MAEGTGSRHHSRLKLAEYNESLETGNRMENELSELSGTVENIIFRNQNNGWTVMELESGGELITVVGESFEITEGDELRVLGEWGSHPSYGRQFRAQSFERKLPATASAILKYLSSGAVKGIGPATAKRILDIYGEESLEIIESSPEKLTQIKGISPKKATEISESYKEQFGIRNCMIFLQQYGVTPSEAIRLWKRFGQQCTDLIQKDPYILCDAGVRISFERADAMAAAMGLPHNSGCRVRAGIGHVLRHNLFSGGHTYIPMDKLVPTAAQMLGEERKTIEEALESMASDQNVEIADFGGRQAVFLPEAYRAESYIAGRLSLMTAMTPDSMGDNSIRIAEAEREYGIKYAQKQRGAIETACSKRVMVLTGGPGTGKTTTINAIIRIFEGMGLKVALAAPTGRAAKRMSEVSGKEAKTIHRLLEMEYTDDGTPRFSRNEKNQLDCDALIVDELSMVDVMLLESLLRAMKLTCRIVMVGDADQLPPVGSGNALRDMIESHIVPVVELDEIFRQASLSLIVTNAHKIVRGTMPDLSKRDGDFFFMRRYTAPQVTETVTALVKSRLPGAYGYSPLWDIQVLVPGRKGELGANELNQALQQALNPPRDGVPERKYGVRVFRQGDKVMQIKNNYDIVWVKENGEHGTGIFNGDVGCLETLDRRTGMMKIRFEDRVAEYPPDGADEIDLAYAVTVHKSQGSEFRAVVLPLFSGTPLLLYRNLLYTAVTRARELAILVGRPEVVETMVNNDKKTKRYTGLCHLLEGLKE